MNDVTGCNSFIDTVVLNRVQKDAVIYNDGPQLVFAGAGTGKTRVLTAKIAFLIKEIGLHPHNIFAATFTNKAAEEMRDRIEKYIGISCTGLWIGTFHSLCVRILRREAYRIGYNSAFTIYDSADQLSLIKKIMKDMQLSERTIQPKNLVYKISQYKNECISPNELDNLEKSFYKRQVIAAYGLYQKSLKEAVAMDFDDLISNTVYLFRKNPEILNSYQKQFKYVLVDEYQDTNTSQFLLVKLLAQSNKRIFVVGDDDQSIYGWRGAKISNILSFDKVFTGTKVFTLEQNYRSSKTILDFANAIISANAKRAEKKLWTPKDDSRDVVVTRYSDNRQEAKGVIEKIKDMMARNIEPGNIAILFRTNAQSRSFEDELRKQNIRYVLVRGVSFYERREVKDCLAYLRLLVNPKDNISCERILNVPPKGIGLKTKEKLFDIAQSKGKSLLEIILDSQFETVSSKARKGLKDLSELFSLLWALNDQKAGPQEILKRLLKVSGYIEMLENEDTEESQARLENIYELVNALTIWNEENPNKGLSDFLEEVSLATDIDGWKQQENAVNLMTFHCAKGLEFKAVFLVGLEDGLIPSSQNFDDELKLEEECRLFYVGSTRAMQFLECSYADVRMRFGLIKPMRSSRFLEKVSPLLYRFIDQSMMIYKGINVTNGSFKKRPVRKNSVLKKQMNIQKTYYDELSQETVQFRMGQIVSHNKYGQGKILNINGFGVDMQLTVLFNDGNRKRMLAKYANLQTA